MSRSLQHLKQQRAEALSRLSQHQRDVWQTITEKQHREKESLEIYFNQGQDQKIEHYENQNALLNNQIEHLNKPAHNQMEQLKAELAQNRDNIINIQNEKSAQRQDLAHRQQNELVALSAEQMKQTRAVEKSNEPVRLAHHFTDEPTREINGPKPEYKLEQPGFNRIRVQSSVQESQASFNQNTHAKPKNQDQNQESKSALEQAHDDLSKSHKPSHFDKVSELENQLRDDFNQTADPFSNDQEFTRDR